MSVAKGKYHIWTVGCQMNMADSQRVSSILDSLGWEEVPPRWTAPISSCSTRAACASSPRRRAHGQLSLLRHAKRQPRRPAGRP